MTREELYRDFALLSNHPLDEQFSFEEIDRRLQFFMEEVNEFVEAAENLEMNPCNPHYVDTVAHLLKEMADVQYTLSGFAATFGLDLNAAYERVHWSNLSKFYPEPEFDENGKVKKGKNYKKPQLEDLVP